MNDLHVNRQLRLLRLIETRVAIVAGGTEVAKVARENDQWSPVMTKPRIFLHHMLRLRLLRLFEQKSRKNVAIVAVATCTAYKTAGRQGSHPDRRPSRAGSAGLGSIRTAHRPQSRGFPNFWRWGATRHDGFCGGCGGFGGCFRLTAAGAWADWLSPSWQFQAPHGPP